MSVIMADKLSDKQPGRTDHMVRDSSEKAMDAEKQALRSKDPGVALEFLHSEETTVMTDGDEKRLARRIDWRIVSLLWESPRPRIGLMFNPYCYERLHRSMFS
jgi:hypothetical protein